MRRLLANYWRALHFHELRDLVATFETEGGGAWTDCQRDAYYRHDPDGAVCGRPDCHKVHEQVDPWQV